MADPRSIVELRVLDGPNRHFAHPTMQLRLDGERLLSASSDDLTAWLKDADLDLEDDVGEPGSVQRHATVLAWLRAVTWQLARLDGGGGLNIRVRPGHEPGELLVAFPWSGERRATLLARWIGWAVDDIGHLPLGETLDEAGPKLRRASSGPRPTVRRPQVPVVAITGTNGKTTTTRLVAHILMTAGRRTAWNSTDGVYVANADLSGGDLVESGDWAGFSGAGRVLDTPGIDVAVIEAARGGILRRGLGVAQVDVGVVTNVSADHMGDMGVHTLEDLAEVKATVVRAVAEDGAAVLNADDHRVAAMADLCRGRVIGFAPDPASEGLAVLAKAGARQVTLVDGWITCVDEEAVPVVDVVEVPMTIAGLSAHNLANALAATAATWGLGLATTDIAAGLRTFIADAERNPGRLNVYVRDAIVIVVDIAHNAESLEALCKVGRGLVTGAGTFRLIAGTIGDRSDQIITEIGELSARLADVAVIAEKDTYLRGRDGRSVIDLLNAGAAKAGSPALPEYPDELVALDAVLAEVQPGDAIAFTVHVHLAEIAEQMAARGFHPATGTDLAARAAEGA